MKKDGWLFTEEAGSGSHWGFPSVVWLFSSTTVSFCKHIPDDDPLKPAPFKGVVDGESVKRWDANIDSSAP